MKKDIAVRKAVLEDVPAIVELWKELMDINKQYDERFTRSEAGHDEFISFINDCVEDKDCHILVAETDENIVGYCVALIRPCIVPHNQRYGHICNLCVSSKYQNKGIGKKLSEETVDWFQQNGISHVEVCVAMENNSAEKFYTKIGFTPYVKTLCLEI